MRKNYKFIKVWCNVEFERITMCRDLAAALCYFIILGNFRALCDSHTNQNQGLNLYLSREEVNKLLGLNNELYYVRDGMVNDYASKFSVRVQTDTNQLHFNWYNSGSDTLTYSIGYTISNSEALNTPSLNISKWGSVPHKLSVFRVGVQCSGLLTAEVELIINLNITTLSRNTPTAINLRRNKMCIKGSNPVQPESAEQNLSADSDPTVIYVVCVSVFLLVVLLVTLSASLYCRRTARVMQTAVTKKEGPPGQTDHLLRPDTASSIAINPPGNLEFTHTVPGRQQLGLTKGLSNHLERLAAISVPRSNIILGDSLLEGTFGRVIVATLLPDGKEVMVKTVTSQASELQSSLLVQEGCVFMGLDHPHLEPVRRVCLDDPRTPLLLYSVPAHGILKKFLLNCKFSPDGYGHVVVTQDLVLIAIQVVEAIIYLHAHQILHGDLATRNCLLNEGLQVQVTDNALSRDIFPNDYHCLGDNENRPIKWLALESLTHKQFSPASDVWSFGVLLWELMTLGQQPYVGVDPFEMSEYLRGNYRLQQPLNCPDELFSVMTRCWKLNIEDRPTLTQLLVVLQDFYTALTRYV